MTTKKITVVQQTIQTLQHMRPKLAQVLPPQIDVDKFIRTASGAIQNNPELAESNKSSLFLACQRAAQDGLIIDGREAALVLFNKKSGNKWEKHAQYMPMVAGILKKARNSGEISTINAYTVGTEDGFEYTLGIEPHIHHVPNLDAEENPLRLTYAVAKLKDGAIQLEVMTKAQIEKVRRSSKSGSHKETGEPIGIWKAWYDEMARKTVLRRLCKYLPSSTDLDGVLAASDEQFDIRKPEPQPQTIKPSGQTRAESVILGNDDNIEDAVIVDEEPPSHTEEPAGVDDPI